MAHPYDHFSCHMGGPCAFIIFLYFDDNPLCSRFRSMELSQYSSSIVVVQFLYICITMNMYISKYKFLFCFMQTIVYFIFYFFYIHGILSLKSQCQLFVGAPAIFQHKVQQKEGIVLWYQPFLKDHSTINMCHCLFTPSAVSYMYAGHFNAFIFRFCVCLHSLHSH